MFTHLRVIHSSVNKRNQNKTRTCQLIFVNDFKFDSQILECESTRKVYIAYTNWCVNRMMQEKERTTIHLELLQVGLTSFLVSGASFSGCEVAERATKSGKVYKSAFFESLLFIVFKTNSLRQSTHLLVEYAFWNSCPRLKRKIQAKAMSRCILEQLKFAFGSLSTQPNVTKILFWFAIEKKYIRVTYRQMNASVFLLREVDFYPWTQQKMLQN